jgi:hypothetical protein
VSAEASGGPAAREALPDAGQRALWLAVRQGLLLICAAIERHYGVTRCQR